ncbi:MAG: hypothetical protein L3K15_02920 [Thermoplasmata archaeon]|nr:hypothetical protein [Thermoplasmata archaeon]
MPDVLVVAESPSLGSAIYELVRAGGLAATAVADLADAILAYDGSTVDRPRVLVSASASRKCQTAAVWNAGPLSTTPLIVVGDRDLDLPGADRIHFVTFPLSPPRLLDLVRRLVNRTEVEPAPPES